MTKFGKRFKTPQNGLVFFVFLVLNFGALWIGTILMENGPNDSWYLGLNKAPWTPPGWVFGAAWTTIMLLYSCYMTILWKQKANQTIIVLFFIQWLLNVGWNWFFFNQHEMFISELVLFLLTFIIGFFLVFYNKKMHLYSLLLVPYLMWLLVANSLNLYVLLYN